MRILVALSGGIDSSVVAHLLARDGHDLVGVRFTLWHDPLAPALAALLPSKCCNAQTAARTTFIAKQLGIPLHIIDLERAFKEQVVDPFLRDYACGLTPNPCISCNRTIKFGRLLNIMREHGCEKMATGHYARVGGDGSTAVLREAIDATKDQSYYLYGLSQDQLRAVLFPLGALCKSRVFALAREFGIPFDDQYRESQDLCFFPEKEPREFLKRHLGAASLRPGPIVRKDGEQVGEHAGLPLYTVGQRRGLRIGGLKIPLEVIAKNTAGNALIVDEKNGTRIASVTLSDVRFIGAMPAEGAVTPFTCRVRSSGPKHTGSLSYNGSQGIFTFDTAMDPLAPGQSLVLYAGDRIVGGGVMGSTICKVGVGEQPDGSQRQALERSERLGAQSRWDFSPTNPSFGALRTGFFPIVSSHEGGPQDPLVRAIVSQARDR